MKKPFGWAALAFVVIVTVVLAWGLSGLDPDTRFSGAYALPDDSFLYISPEGHDRLRFRTLSGQSGLLWRATDNHFEGGKGFAEREPVFHRFEFELDSSDEATELVWEQPGVAPVRAPRVRLDEQPATFQSGDVRLRGKLIMPEGGRTLPAVLFIDGWKRASAVDNAFEPYLYASRGFATLVFDTRGTGKSTGEYTQNFRVLATDALAALKWLRDQPRIDATNVHLVGVAEGGWIAPMAAARDANVRSVLVCHGPLVSAFEQDRWRYVSALRRSGFDDAAIAEADHINAILGDIVDRRIDRWDDFAQALKEARGRRWFPAIEDSHSLFGELAHSSLPLWAMRLKVASSLNDEPAFIDRLYDPLPTAAALKSPSYWILAEQDSSMPTDWTIEALNKLQRQRKPVDYLLYPDAEHGSLRIEQRADGSRKLLGYEPDYFKVQIDWLKRNSGPRLEMEGT